jgi:DNA-binding NtrC family response regulator
MAEILKRQARVLVVEDDPNSLEVTTAFVAESGAEVVAASSVDEARSALSRHGSEISLVITDIRLRHQSGLDLFREVRRHHPEVPVILVTAYGNADEAVAAMRDGALYYFTKPVNFPLLLRLVAETLEKGALQAEVAHLKAQLANSGARRILGSSRAIRTALAQAASVASLDTTVLLSGETGTGKDLFAEYIHEQSPRRSRPFVAINCAALPETLLESELFGHERGAFTGAVARRPGKFEAASGGTLFLDEVGDMSLALQSKLLRALESGQISPLGSTATVHVNVRTIGATNRDLAAAVSDGVFRKDLYYRLNVFPIALPPLRERVEDIPALARWYLHEYGTRMGKQFSGIDAQALDALLGYSWPGNVRELCHVIERAAILCSSATIGFSDLPPSIVTSGTSADRREPDQRGLADLKREAILRALADAGGNQSKAARALGISRNQIQYWLRTQGPRS